MSLAGFIIYLLALLFGYNFAITEWLKYQERRRQRKLQERRNRYQ
jgi:hypothetical protein